MIVGTAPIIMNSKMKRGAVIEMYRLLHEIECGYLESQHSTFPLNSFRRYNQKEC